MHKQSYSKAKREQYKQLTAVFGCINYFYLVYLDPILRKSIRVVEIS